MRTLKLLIVAGEKTCYEVKGKHCDYLRTSHFGQKFHCGIFNQELQDKDGWLQRCQDCLSKEVQHYEIP